MGIHYILQTLSTAQGTDTRTDLFARATLQDCEASVKKAATTWEIVFWVPASGYSLQTFPVHNPQSTIKSNDPKKGNL